jgi:hypothetical protein
MLKYCPIKLWHPVTAIWLINVHIFRIIINNSVAKQMECLKIRHILNSSDYEEILYQPVLIGLTYDYALMMLSNFKIMLTY